MFSLTWAVSMQIYWNKRKRLNKKRVQLPQDWFGTPTWPPFYSFGTPIWPPWRHVNTLYGGISKGFSGWDNRKMKNDPIVPIHPRSICTLLLTRPHDLHWKWAGTYWSEVSRGVLFWILVGGCLPVPQILSLFHTELEMSFFYTSFQAWLLKVIIGLQNLYLVQVKSTNWLIFLVTISSFRHWTLLRAKMFRYTLVVPLKTMPYFSPSISVFRPKRLKNPTLWGGTYLYSLNIPPPPSWLVL